MALVFIESAFAIALVYAHQECENEVSGDETKTSVDDEPDTSVTRCGYSLEAVNKNAELDRSSTRC
jgi:hypothetical protein